VTSAPGDHPEARAEYLEAVAYYDDLRAGLGEELIDRFENAIQEILGDPNSWPLVPEWDEEPVLRSRRIERRSDTESSTTFAMSRFGSSRTPT
jgi:hypothetical protein